MHKRLEHMKETLMCAVEMQLCDLGSVDTKELGETIDMIKDLEEAIYYCTVTEAMNSPKTEMEFEMKKGNDEHHYKDGGRMYTNSYKMYADGASNAQGGRSSTSYKDSEMMHSNEPMWRDDREGRSYNSRRMYMEAKDMKKDKATQLKELEKYMQELSTDITEMIADASTDEKAYIEKKMTILANKIGQMK